MIRKMWPVKMTSQVKIISDRSTGTSGRSLTNRTLLAGEFKLRVQT